MKKGLETYLFSTLGIVLMLALLIAINVIASPFTKRIDLTDDRTYTLAEGTKKILSRLDTPVQIRFYCSRSNPQFPVMLKNYADRVEDILNEYRTYSKGQIEIQKLDPEPDTDAEDSAKLDGIEPQIRKSGT